MRKEKYEPWFEYNFCCDYKGDSPIYNFSPLDLIRIIFLIKQSFYVDNTEVIHRNSNQRRS